VVANAADPRHRTAFTDWLACAVAGLGERAARAARAAGAEDGLGGRVLATAAAGHVLDFDDTYAPGLAHLSAPTAPAALILGAELDASLSDVLDAYAAGFEAMGALARASHPALYERGWHPTAVCGAVGAAVSAARLLGAGPQDHGAAARLALLQASGLRRAFGSDAKSLQVGAAAAAGVRAARLAAAGATATGDLPDGPGGWEEAFGGTWTLSGESPAVAENWIKAYPCCLKTHAPIEAAEAARAGLGDAEEIVVSVHPRARQAAPYDDVEDGLQAKFSIPYTVALTLLHGAPAEPARFDAVDPGARALAADRVRVRLDDSLPETAATIGVAGEELARVDAAIGSPARPMPPERLAEKVARLGAEPLAAMLDAPDTGARELAARAFEARPAASTRAA
jgi:2-methylcitrate dehydratase PrpD